MPSFKYRTYGLDVESELACQRLNPSLASPQVSVRFGPVPERLEHPTFKNEILQNSPSEFLLSVDKLGRFYVSKGCEIWIEPHPVASHEELETLVFASLFGMILHQRMELPLHASAIATDRGAVLFTGPSGYGKSTLAGEFFNRGYSVLSDDICAISTHEGTTVMHPARSSILLRDDSLEKLSFTESELTNAVHRAGKKVLPVGDSFTTDAIPIRAVYELSPQDVDETSVVALFGLDSISLLLRNVYRGQLIERSLQASHWFNQLATLANRATISIVQRPKDGFHLRELADVLESDLRKPPVKTNHSENQ